MDMSHMRTHYIRSMTIISSNVILKVVLCYIVICTCYIHPLQTFSICKLHGSHPHIHCVFSSVCTICSNNTYVMFICVQANGCRHGSGHGCGKGGFCMCVCVLMSNIILTYLCLFNIHRMLNVRISHLSEDLHARDEQVKSLLPQLK